MSLIENTNLSSIELIQKMNQFMESLDGDQRAQIYQTMFELRQVTQSPDTKVFIINDLILADQNINKLDDGCFNNESDPSSSLLKLAAVVQVGEIVLTTQSTGAHFGEALLNCKHSLIQALRHIRDILEPSTDRLQKIAILCQEKGRYMLH